MKKTLIFLISFLLIFSIAYADISIETIIPDRIEPNQPFQITININTNEENLDFTQMVPQNWNIYNIEVIGTEQYTTEQETRNFMGKTREIYVWSFKNIETEHITISYETTAPEEGEFEIITLWITPNNFDYESHSLLTPHFLDEIEEEPTEIFKYWWVLVIIIVSLIIFFLLFFNWKRIIPPKKHDFYKVEWNNKV